MKSITKIVMFLMMITMPVMANDIYVTQSGATLTFDVLQDGEDNNIDFDIISMDGFIIDIDQVGNDNTLDITVDGRTSNGSSMYFSQSGNNNSYSGNFWCGHSFCTMTITQGD